jgi:ATP-dependent helicase/nuclease subunit A
VTRARQRLVMSAVVKADRNGQWQVSGDSPLAWLQRHYRLDMPPSDQLISWPDPELQVELVTSVRPLTSKAEERRELPAPWNFHPEAAPYQVRFPSQLATPLKQARHLEAGLPEDGDAARIRGEVMHRAIDTLTRGESLPDTASLAAALRQGGLAAAKAASLAPEIKAELEACQADPFLAGLLRLDLSFAASEWLLEDQPEPGILRRGVLDRLAFDGKNWWLLDFKTSRPAAGEDFESFIAQETEKYRPQLTAYREMAAKAKGLIEPEEIQVGIYFTACQKVVKI